jgi:predicted outer membrane repeat protein
LNNNLFINNTAQKSGGAIFCDSFCSTKDLIFKNNNASSYGPNLAGSSLLLEVINDKKRILQQKNGLVGLRIAAKDAFGQIVTTENEKKIRMRVFAEDGLQIDSIS